MSNYSSKTLNDINIGDEIVGIDNNTKIIRKSTVLDKWEVTKPAYKIVLSDGRELIASDSHRFLTSRGYKYVTGKEQGLNRRPFLTNNNKVISLYNPISDYIETDMYKMGYLSGIIQGDGNLKIYNDKRNNNLQLYLFRLVLNNEDYNVIVRAKEYLNYFGILVNEFVFNYNMKGIRLNKRLEHEKIQRLIKFTFNKEWFRGFVAGIFDAEGTSNSCRIYNTNGTIINYIKKAYKIYGFRYTISISKYKNKKDVIVISILGGRCEYIRFHQLFRPVLKRKLFLYDTKIKSNNYPTIRLIKYIGISKLIDIKTSTENYISNGIISHNCYGKYDFTRQGMSYLPEFHPERLNEPYSVKAGQIFVTHYTDLMGEFIPTEWIEPVIGVCRSLPRHTFMFLSKNPRRYLEFDFPDNCMLGITVESIDKWDRVDTVRELKNRKWISIEPIFGDFTGKDFTQFELVVIGKLFNSYSKIKAEWVRSIVHDNIFYKPSVRRYL